MEDNKIPGIIKIQDIKIDLTEGKIWVIRITKGRKKERKTALNLSVIELGILYLLASSTGKIFTREEIIEKVYDRFFSQLHDIDVAVSRLRKKLVGKKEGEKLTKNERDRYIKTIHGMGYQIVL